MTRNLVAAGHQVTVASRSRRPVDEAVAFGAIDGGTVTDVAAASEVLVLCVPNSPDVAQVLDDDASPALGPGHDRGRLLDDRPRRRAGPARNG